MYARAGSTVVSGVAQLTARALRMISLVLLLFAQALHSAHAGVGDNLLTSSLYSATCGLANFEPSLSSCPGPLATWTKVKTGRSTTQFSIITEASGNHAAYLKASKYVRGAAFWRHNPVSVKPSTMYRYSVMVKTDAATTAWAEVEFLLTNGNYRYLPLSTVGPIASWTKFTDDFYTPSDVATATVYVFLRSNGTVTIDDVAVIELAPPSAPAADAYLNYALNRPLVSITFDDGTGDIWNNAVPLLQDKGFKTTQYVVSSFVGTDGFLSVNNLVDMNNAGHELASHSATHPSLPGLSTTNLQNETSVAQTTLRSRFPNCYLDNMFLVEQCFDQFAYPYGDVNQAVLSQTKLTYRSSRGTNDGLNTLNLNYVPTTPPLSMQAKYRLHAQIVLNPTVGGGGVDELNGWLATATASKTWLILLYHRVNSLPDAYGLTPAQFSEHLDAIAGSGVCVTPVHDALNEVEHQGDYRASCGGASTSASVARAQQRIRAVEPTKKQILTLNEGWGRFQKHDPSYWRKEYKLSRFHPTNAGENGE